MVCCRCATIVYKALVVCLLTQQSGHRRISKIQRRWQRILRGSLWVSSALKKPLTPQSARQVFLKKHKFSTDVNQRRRSKSGCFLLRAPEELYPIHVAEAWLRREEMLGGPKKKVIFGEAFGRVFGFCEESGDFFDLGLLFRPFGDYFSDVSSVLKQIQGFLVGRSYEWQIRIAYSKSGFEHALSSRVDGNVLYLS